MNNPKTSITINHFVRDTAKKFEESELALGQGTDSYWDEAVYLTILGLGMPPDITIDQAQEYLTPLQLAELEKLVTARVEERKPLPYLAGSAWYRGRQFIIDENVIIPRSPIGEIIDNDFFGYLNNTDNPRLLDMCTGSGALAILMAEVLPFANVDAIDISPDALKVATKNLTSMGLSNRVNLIESDLFTNLSDARGKYDLIISNPPYVGLAEYDELLPEFKQEPKGALVCGDNGLSIPMDIVKSAKQFLHEDGGLIIEVGYSQDEFDIVTKDYDKEWISLSEGGSGVAYFPYDAL